MHSESNSKLPALFFSTAKELNRKGGKMGSAALSKLDLKKTQQKLLESYFTDLGGKH